MTIKQIQCLLLYLGYNPGVIDGVTGPNTQAAVTVFQEQEGLEVDGKPGPKTQVALLDAVTNGRMHNDVDEAPAVDENTETGDTSTPATGTFWDDIQYFTREEFRCKCGGKYCSGFPAEPQEKLLRTADRVRGYFGSPATVSSGIRCTTHNANVGGVSNSRHLSGKAMDFCVSGRTAAAVLAYVQQQPEIRYAYAIDGNFVHMDIE